MSLKIFNAADGSTMYDVCLNTYGTLNLLVKLMVDNKHPGVNLYPVAGQEFVYDDELVYNLPQQQNNTVIYATS